jgi:hypothetical protein
MAWHPGLPSPTDLLHHARVHHGHAHGLRGLGQVAVLLCELGQLVGGQRAQRIVGDGLCSEGEHISAGQPQCLCAYPWVVRPCMWRCAAAKVVTRP